MLRKIARLFVIKTRFEAMAIIYALALGAVTRGYVYMAHYPGFVGYLFFAACTGAVFMAGAKILEVTRPDSGKRRRRTDLEGDHRLALVAARARVERRRLSQSVSD